MLRHFAMPEESNYSITEERGPNPAMQMQNRCAKKEKRKPTPQENSEVNLRITIGACSARVPTRAPGLRPYGFWGLPGKSDWASAALTKQGSILWVSVSLPQPVLCCWLRAFAPGLESPTTLSCSPIGQAPKPTSHS